MSCIKSLEGKVVDIISFDFEKAFDKINHHKLLDSLNFLGFSLSLINLIHNYLTSRSFTVRVGDDISTPREVTSGVPHGSVLGPFLFSLYIMNDPKLESGSLLEFADDTKLCVVFDSINMTARDKIQKDINSFTSWVTDIEIKLNSSKTTVLHLEKGTLTFIIQFKENKFK